MKLRPLAFAITSIITTSSFATEKLETVIISADLRETSVQDISASVDVKTQSDIQDQGATHFDDILMKTSNVNHSGQSSRARHIQIRGIGERDEYTGAPNASVGFAIDDIDFSGIGMVGNLFDVEQVEVLRGPQNTRYGQSAIGGLINIETNDPTPYRESMIEASGGQDNLKEFGLMTSGPVSKEEGAAQYRISVFKHSSDGFRDNDTLNRSDTNGKDELTVRGKLRLFPNQNTTVDISLLHSDLNNGYDAWSRDNSFTTLSNQPGKDTQLSNAGSVKINWKGNPNFVFTSKTTLANSDMSYSFDEDWTANSGGTYLNNKHRRTMSQELRWTSTPVSRINDNTDWLFGFYGSKLDETNQTEYWGSSSSDFSLSKLAGFGQLDYAMTPKATITAGLRIENDGSNFSNSAEESYSPDETLWGANLTYSYQYNETHTAFAGITRGYKAGGFNPGLPDDSPVDFVSYSAETLYNYEIGLHSHFAPAGLKTNVTLFYMDRHNPQFDGNTYDPYSGNNWVFYTENFNSAQNYGLEGDFEWQANDSWNFYGSLGLMQTRISGAPQDGAFTIEGREQAHAPTYQGNFGIKYRHSKGFYAQTDLSAVDAFYFDNVHDIKSDAYQLINARIGYETSEYEIYLWGKNLTDEQYATRGYYFDFNSPYTNPSEYVHLGDPRQIGLTARVYF